MPPITNFILPIILLLFVVIEIETTPIALKPIRINSESNLFQYHKHFSAPPTVSFLKLKKAMLKQAKISNKNRRIILASNAPPFHLEEVRKDYPVKQRLQKSQFNIKNVKSEGDMVRMKEGLISSIGKESIIQNQSARKWIIKQASGGLVSAVEPVMENSKENIWVFHVTASNSSLPPEDDPKLKAIEKHKSKSNFGLRSVLIDDQTYHYYYEDISNCILWPALHNIQENITVHDNERVFNEAINAYKNVNKQFAQTIFDLERTENDFIWIQDYHLMFVGFYLRQMENEKNFKKKKPMELGFFLHTPFELAKEFTEKFNEFGVQIINGILNFDKVGFQTNKDRQKFINLAVKLFNLNEEHKPKNIINLKNNYITPVNGCNLGVYPATINVNEFIKIAEMESTLIEARKFRENIMANTLEGGKLFFSVERFDYTKGIYEKLEGFKKYLERYPDRIGRDVFYQIAPYNRRNIENYKNYQNNSLKIKERIKVEFGEGSTKRNDNIKILEGYEPFIIELEGVPREKLVTRYLAMDVGVVTPVMDGMNLVAKEMIASNPIAPLVLSNGAGTHHQLKENGLGGNYFLVEDIKNSEHFADVLHDSTVLSEERQEIRGEKLREYLKNHSVDKWSEEFLNE